MLALTLFTASPLAAQEGPQAILAEGETVEVELRGDFNADGQPDLAYIAKTEETRELRVVTSYVDEVNMGENIPQVLPLDSYPLGDGILELKGNVLLLKDLTGGTTAVSSTHRFRWDAKLQAMRLIGLDATLYSRTFAHDGREVSWNLMTGDFTSHTMKLRNDGSDIAYDEVDRQRKKKPSKPLKLEDSPSGDDLLGWPGAK